jgi:anti-sigma factor RsiW
MKADGPIAVIPLLNELVARGEDPADAGIRRWLERHAAPARARVLPFARSTGGRILFSACDGPHTAARCSAALPEKEEQRCDPPQEQVNRKGEVHVDSQHGFNLLSLRDDGPVDAGPLLRAATPLFPLRTTRTSVKPLGKSTPILREKRCRTIPFRLRAIPPKAVRR